MWILTIRGEESEGAYAMENEDGNKTLFLLKMRMTPFVTLK